MVFQVPTIDANTKTASQLIKENRRDHEPAKDMEIDKQREFGRDFLPLQLQLSVFAFPNNLGQRVKTTVC